MFCQYSWFCGLVRTADFSLKAGSLLAASRLSTTCVVGCEVVEKLFSRVWLTGVRWHRGQRKNRELSRQRWDGCSLTQLKKLKEQFSTAVQKKQLRCLGELDECLGTQRNSIVLASAHASEPARIPAAVGEVCWTSIDGALEYGRCRSPDAQQTSQVLATTRSWAGSLAVGRGCPVLGPDG